MSYAGDAVEAVRGTANPAMTTAGLDRIEDQRLNSWYGQLAERLARIDKILLD